MPTSTNDDIGVKYYSAHTVSGLEMNTVWDGIFHTFCRLSVLVGLALLYARVTHSRRQVWTSRVLWGWILAGWGLFNVVEGILDHHILGIHHVRTGPGQTWWDLGFLLLGVLSSSAGGRCNAAGSPSRPTLIAIPPIPGARHDDRRPPGA